MQNDTLAREGDDAEVDHERRERERREIGDRPHVEGITRGTVVEYADWQWALVSEVAEDHEPPMFGFILLDEIDDKHTESLESAWGCLEHYEAVKQFRGTEQEYWTDIEYITEDDIWQVLGPIHPDERGVEA